MPVETAITATGTIFVFEAIVETETDYSGRSIPSAEPFEKLRFDWERRVNMSA